MRINLSKKYGNGVLFHKAVFHEYQSLNRKQLIDQTISKETSGLILTIYHNKFA